jgi:hypothetical protein
MVIPLNYEPDLDKVQRFSRIDGVWVHVDQNWQPTGQDLQPNEAYSINDEQSPHMAKLLARIPKDGETARTISIPGNKR